MHKLVTNNFHACSQAGRYGFCESAAMPIPYSAQTSPLHHRVEWITNSSMNYPYGRELPFSTCLLWTITFSTLKTERSATSLILRLAVPATLKSERRARYFRSALPYYSYSSDPVE
jgi:hypothetical protein